MRILHFADAHIDMVTQGRHDPASGLAVRTLDFLKSLDTIVDTAIDEKVDLVIFAGDAYKDRTPVPTFQREWGRRIARLGQAGIPTVLLVGNHDLSPAAGRAHALQEFETLAVPFVRVVGKPCFLGPDDLNGLPLQMIALPWITRSFFMASQEMSAGDVSEVYSAMEGRLGELVGMWLEKADPNLPIVLTAHATVEGAVYGGERSVMLGNDLTLSGSLVRDPRLSYVALGHIHKAQDVNDSRQPPVIYPGSIERVDFGEAADNKFFVIAHIEAEQETRVEWRKLEGRRFIDRFVRLSTSEAVNETLLGALPPQDDLKDAIVRLVVEYPFQWEGMIDEAGLRNHCEECLEFHFIRRPQRETRLRLSSDRDIASYSPLELLQEYWLSLKTSPEEIGELQKLAGVVFASSLEAGEKK
jgi:DNA repair protein SbcD/Mre11